MWRPAETFQLILLTSALKDPVPSGTLTQHKYVETFAWTCLALVASLRGRDIQGACSRHSDLARPGRRLITFSLVRSTWHLSQDCNMLTSAQSLLKA